MIIKRINIGELVKQLVKERGMSKAKFAENLCIARQNIDKTVFAKHSLDTDLLCSISEVLDCNLFDYFKSDDMCNQKDYNEKKIVKATISIEMGEEKKDKVFRFVFGSNEIEILNK